jgi:hypothetical protein
MRINIINKEEKKMAKPRKTENPDEILKWINPDMDEETSNGKDEDELDLPEEKKEDESS